MARDLPADLRYIADISEDRNSPTLRMAAARIEVSSERTHTAALRRLCARFDGRGATIRRLLFEREAARAWLCGEIPGFDPMPTPWACMWCGEMIHGGRAEAKQHVLCCCENPLVQRVERLRENSIILKTQLYHCMTLVDLILGGKVTQGTGTCHDTIMGDVDRAKAVVRRPGEEK